MVGTLESQLRIFSSQFCVLPESNAFQKPPGQYTGQYSKRELALIGLEIKRHI